MAERNSFAVSDTGGVLTVEDHRLAMGALWTPGTSNVLARTGFRPGPGTSPGLVTASGTPDGNVHVSPFQLVIQTGRASVGGAYVATLDVDKTINVLSTPAHATNPRNDLIIAQQSDKYYGDATNAFTVKQVVGTPAASPSDPSVSGSLDYITLARVRVDASATTIASGKITDLRPAGLYTVAVGGLLPVPNQTVRDAIGGKYDGFPVYRQDTDIIEVYDGGTWNQPFNSLIGGQSYGGSNNNLAAGIGTTLLSTSMESGAQSLKSGRRYAIECLLSASVTAAGATIFVSLRKSSDSYAADIDYWISPGLAAGIGYKLPFNTDYVPSGDETQTFRLYGKVFSGGGTTTFTRRSADTAPFVRVRELGASSKIVAV